jgi:hypothetical protein
MQCIGFYIFFQFRISSHAISDVNKKVSLSICKLWKWQADDTDYKYTIIDFIQYH